MAESCLSNKPQAHGRATKNRHYRRDIQNFYFIVSYCKYRKEQKLTIEIKNL